jgi:hypothetical protein
MASVTTAHRFSEPRHQSVNLMINGPCVSYRLTYPVIAQRTFPLFVVAVSMKARHIHMTSNA